MRRVMVFSSKSCRKSSKIHRESRTPVIFNYANPEPSSSATSSQFLPPPSILDKDITKACLIFNYTSLNPTRIGKKLPPLRLNQHRVFLPLRQRAASNRLGLICHAGLQSKELKLSTLIESLGEYINHEEPSTRAKSRYRLHGVR